ncbi:hypothetical protein PCANB_002343 [Pneumocystis canis]|nr:hypothetical protein PCANB_002343 [Pneumocystis canis]
MVCDLSPNKVNRIFGWIIPPFLVGVMGFTTWVYIVLICINYLIMHGRRLGIVLLVVFFILLSMVALSFIRIIFTPPGYIPRFKDLKEYLSNDIELGNYITDQMKTFYLYDAYVCENDGFPRWCSVCEVYKPDRAHHCSEVQRCVLKLDHFCPWVGGVIGFTRYNVHIFYIFRNSTTIESINFYARFYLLNILYGTEKSGFKRTNVTTNPGQHPWDLGWMQNWCSVMGEKWWEWMFPFKGSPGNGYHFDYNSNMLSEWKTMATQSETISKCSAKILTFSDFQDEYSKKSFQPETQTDNGASTSVKNAKMITEQNL